MDIMKYENLDIKFLIHKLEMQNMLVLHMKLKKIMIKLQKKL